MSILLFLVTIIVSFIVVTIGAIAFELTGLDWPIARFQALSCFTGTGFTTKESELIVHNTRRRKIATILIILGHAGFVTLVATFANSLRPSSNIDISLSFVHLIFPPHLVPWVNIVIIAIAVYGMYRIIRIKIFTKTLMGIVRKKMMKKELVKTVSFDELLVIASHYSILSFDINKDDALVNKPLRTSGLRDADIAVLLIERGTKVIANPYADTMLLEGDRLICFGKHENVRKRFNP